MNYPKEYYIEIHCKTEIGFYSCFYLEANEYNTKKYPRLNYHVEGSIERIRVICPLPLSRTCRVCKFL